MYFFWLMPFLKKYKMYNSFYKSYIGLLDHDDLYEMVIENISCWGIFDNLKIWEIISFIKQVLCLPRLATSRQLYSTKTGICWILWWEMRSPTGVFRLPCNDIMYNKLYCYYKYKVYYKHQRRGGVWSALQQYDWAGLGWVLKECRLSLLSQDFSPVKTW